MLDGYVKMYRHFWNKCGSNFVKKQLEFLIKVHAVENGAIFFMSAYQRMMIPLKWDNKFLHTFQVQNKQTCSDWNIALNIKISLIAIPLMRHPINTQFSINNFDFSGGLAQIREKQISSVRRFVRWVNLLGRQSYSSLKNKLLLDAASWREELGIRNANGLTVMTYQNICASLWRDKGY